MSEHIFTGGGEKRGCGEKSHFGTHHLELLPPAEIEKRSFEIITRELGGRTFPPDQDPVVKRVIHTTADFDYADNLVFSEGAVAAGREALLSGATVITDTSMAMAGINKRVLARLGSSVRCFMADGNVAAEAMARGVTRAAVSMERAADLPGRKIFAVGNAPTALIRLRELADEGLVSPALIIGVPVGFVNVEAAKEMILELKSVPHIVARGRKGGSSVAAAIVNALLYGLTERR